MIKSTREQIKELRALHPNWSKSDIARACVPPVSPQRIGQIEIGSGPDVTSKEYKEKMRHRYHKRVVLKHKIRKCKYCA